MSDAFDDAKYYTCGDAEELTHECWAEAIAELLDDCHEAGESEAATAARLAPFVVEAYSPVEAPDEEFSEAMALRASEMICEELIDDYGSPERDGGLDDDALGDLRRGIANLIAAAIYDYVPWRCKKVGSRTFTLEELIAEYRPSEDVP